VELGRPVLEQALPLLVASAKLAPVQGQTLDLAHQM